MMKLPIILASTLPRRRDILKRAGVKFEVVDSGYEEDMTLNLKPRALVKYLALGKARAVLGRVKTGLIIGGDSFVVLGNKILGKPKNAAEAKKMLQQISGKKVAVLSGLAVVDADSGRSVSGVSESYFWFKKLSAREIADYIVTGEPLDKAGAFAIQDIGAAFIKKSSGDFWAAMGLSVYELNKLLKKFGRKII